MEKRWFVMVSALALSACQKQSETEVTLPERVTFQFVHASHDERFKAITSDPALIQQARAELRKPLKERILHPSGKVVRGDGGVNAPWSWSFADGEWGLAELSVEVCDAWPGYVEENLDEWLQSPGSFCPWSSRVERELK